MSETHRRMEPIAPILEALLRRHHLHQQVCDYSVLREWPRLVGEHLARNSRPTRIQGETLWVSVEDSTLRHHLGYLVPRILQRIHEELPQSKIQSIRFTVEVPCRQP